MRAGFAYHDTLGIMTLKEPGDESHMLPFDPKVRGRAGFLHGGAIAGMLAIVCDSRAEAEGACHEPATTTMTFVRGGREQSTYASSRICARTARLLVVEAIAWQETVDKAIAVMSRTYLRKESSPEGKE